MVPCQLMKNTHFNQSRISFINFQRNSYRCGIFFAGDELNDPPRFKIFIIPKRFKLDCGQPEEDAKTKAKDGCNELVSSYKQS